MTLKEKKDRFEALMLSFLNQANSQQSMETIIFLLDDKKQNLGKALVAWKNIQVVQSFDIQEKQIEDEWEWVWQFCKYDIKQFALLTDEEQNDSIKLIKKLKTLRLIFPNGHINSIAQGVVRGMIQQGISKSTGQKMGKKTEK